VTYVFDIGAYTTASSTYIGIAGKLRIRSPWHVNTHSTPLIFYFLHPKL